MVAVLLLTSLALVFGLALGFAAQRFRIEGDPVVDQVDALLPQTQCGQCSFAGCRPYAEAIAAGEAEINRCPPGGEATMIALAELLGRDPVPLEDEEAAEKPKAVAYIVEEECIGCTLCIQACPVDAISVDASTGAKVVSEATCVGCKVCTIACPFGTVNYSQATGKVVKCDLCGGDPECVKVCPTATVTLNGARSAAALPQDFAEGLARAYEVKVQDTDVAPPEFTG